MVIIREADLHLIDVPCVVQQYHDHEEALYKVYVIHQDVMVFRRQSLPDLHLRGAYAGTAMRSLAFDSRKNYPTYADFTVGDGGSSDEGPSWERKAEVPSSSVRAEATIDAALFGTSCLLFIIFLSCLCRCIITGRDSSSSHPSPSHHLRPHWSTTLIQTPASARPPPFAKSSA